MNEGPTAEDIELLLSTPEGRKKLEELKRMRTDSGGAQPMTVDPEFVPDTMDEVGYDPDILRQIGASPDNRGATRGLTPEHLDMIKRLIGQR